MYRESLTPEDVAELLEYIPADDRPLWVKVGGIIKDEFGDGGFSTWDDWSRTSGKYNERAARTVWKSLGRADKPATAATLIYLAREHGWVASLAWRERVLSRKRDDAARGAVVPRHKGAILHASAVEAVKASNVGLADWARKLWDSTRQLDGDAVAYLEARACHIPPSDSDLRWHPNLKHPSGHIGPCLVALITDALSNEPISLHRTWVKADGTKPVEPARLLAQGHRKKGGVIRLWPDDAVTDALGIAEGIETALSVAHAFSPVWALIDAGNLSTFPLLDGVDCLTIFADADKAGREAAQACAQRWNGAQREVWQALPPRGDWNDRARAAA